MVLLLKAFRIESRAFQDVMVLVAAAYPVHHFLPAAFRMPFFVAISFASFLLVLGPVAGAGLIGVGIILVGICHLSIPFGARVAGIALAGTVLAAFRVNWIPSGPLGVVWPILGAMFMFRIVVYLYDLRHKSAPFDAWKSLAYFFLVPNICFVLFPVIDYRTFSRTYYNENPFRIYQIGVVWILRGTIQLLLYRGIHQFMTIDPMTIADAGDVVRHMFATYMMYLRVSGNFHIVIGVLHLFGFNLPETHHLYFLSSSFTDFWRRINVYWKDFITKIVFYPTFFRLRKLGPKRSMALATALAFIATWLLHSYQWFWLRGRPLITATDAAFWAMLGLLVTVNVMLDARPKKKTPVSPLKANLVLAAKTITMFTAMMVLWSMWSAESYNEWFAILANLGTISWDDVLLLVGIWIVIGSLAVIMKGSRREWTESAAAALRQAQAPYSFWPSAARVTVTGTVVLASAVGALQAYMPHRVREALESVEWDRLNDFEKAKMQLGYYEDLMRVDRFSPELNEVYGERPANYFVPFRQAMNKDGEGFHGRELTKSAQIDYLGVHYSTNQWGLRDKEYTKEKPAGTYRIALIGTSISMGWGIPDGQTFESIVEDRLAVDHPGRYEILNFSVNGFDPLRKLYRLENAALEFQPDMVIFCAHRIDRRWIVENILRCLRNDIAIPYPYVEEIIAKAGVTSETGGRAAANRLSKYSADLVAWAFRRVVEICNERNIKVVWMFEPEVERFDFVGDKVIRELFTLAGESGFAVMIDLRGAYEGVPPSSLKLETYDEHPNVRAHGLLAEYVYEQLTTGDPPLLPKPSGER